MYTDGSDCANSWREWDNYCRDNRDTNERCSSIEIDYNKAVEEAAAEDSDPVEFDQIPGVECFTEDAWNYRGGTTCAANW